MTSRERMMIALDGGRPDRLPITIHQWQNFHLETYMDGMDQVEAYASVGLDASICAWDALTLDESSNWIREDIDLGTERGEHFVRHNVTTPDGLLTWVTASNAFTSYRSEHPAKDERDLEVFLKHYPRMSVDRKRVTSWYDQVGEGGIVRGFVSLFGQSGPWQDFCELVGTQDAIFWALDDPSVVHFALEALTESKVRFVHEELPGVRFDLVECGGGAASSTVISPAMFEEFCLPYDRRINEALRAEGFRSVYHTCGGMMDILDLIPLNKCDVSETLSPPGVGGDIPPTKRQEVKEKLGSRVALIGGVDQHNVLEKGSVSKIKEEVQSCFETFGRGGGYICSASDHFFHAPRENLMSLAQAALACTY